VVHPFGICARTDNLLLFPAGSKSTSLDLSKATKIKDVVFQPISQSVEWITATLKTIPKHRDLQEVSIYLPSYVAITGVGRNASQVIGEENWGEWLDLDRLLVQFWESGSIRPKVVCPMRAKRGLDPRHRVEYRCLLPEITKRGIIDLVEPPLCYSIR
jgi:hypothetical protein